MRKHKFYYTCPLCGANLDIGEKCEDCSKKLNLENDLYKYYDDIVYSEDNVCSDKKFINGTPTNYKTVI